MALLLPTFDEPAYEYDVTLDGRDYVLRYTYSERQDAWSLDVMLPDETELATGLKLSANIPLLHRYNDDRLPAGQLLALSMEDPPQDPGRHDLGSKVRMVYIPADELPDADDDSSPISIAIV